MAGRYRLSVHTADKPEVTASYTSQEVTTGLYIQTFPVHSIHCTTYKEITSMSMLMLSYQSFKQSLFAHEQQVHKTQIIKCEPDSRALNTALTPVL